MTTLILALEENKSLTSLNLEGTNEKHLESFSRIKTLKKATRSVLILWLICLNLWPHIPTISWSSGWLGSNRRKWDLGEIIIYVCYIILEFIIDRVESKIADAICKNPRLIKIGMKFEFKDVLNR